MLRFSFKSIRHAQRKQFLLLFLLGILLAIIHLRCGENPLEPPQPESKEVKILANSFDPMALSISVGTKVVWVNKDNATHGIVSGRPRDVVHDFPQSNNLKLNDKHEVTFDRPGTFPYFCNIHPEVHGVGEIIVR
jgi:plastocyanin